MLHVFGRGENEMCAACFSGRYPVPSQEPEEQKSLFSGSSEAGEEG